MHRIPRRGASFKDPVSAYFWSGPTGRASSLFMRLPGQSPGLEDRKLLTFPRYSSTRNRGALGIVMLSGKVKTAIGGTKSPATAYKVSKFLRFLGNRYLRNTIEIGSVISIVGELTFWREKELLGSFESRSSFATTITFNDCTTETVDEFSPFNHKS